MMRSLFSGVSGLRTHQTRMDVIGNNIANVNTTAFKSKQMNFSDMLYQTTQAATGANSANNTGGTNPRQIGLGVKAAAINTTITQEGANQSTGNPFDLKISGEAFFVVSDGTSTYYTRDGSFDVDDAGNLCMASTGYIVQGWAADENGDIVKGNLRPINTRARNDIEAEATKAGRISGMIDSNSSELQQENGRVLTIAVYDKAGYTYNVKFGILPVTMDKTETRSTLNTENEYVLSKSIYKVDTSKLTYKYKTANNEDKELKSSDMPAELLEKLETEIRKVVNSNGATTSTGIAFNSAGAAAAHQIGDAGDWATVDLGAFIKAYKDIDDKVLQQSELRGMTLTVNFSGGIGFAKEPPTSYPVTDAATIPQEAVNQFYDVDGADPSKYNCKANTASVTSVKQTYTDDNGNSVTQYIFKDNSGNEITVTPAGSTTAVNVGSLYGEATMKLLGMGTKSDKVNTYTTNSPQTSKQVVPKEFTLSLLGITDENQAEVNIDALKNGGTTSWTLKYNEDDGQFSYVGQEGQSSFTLNLSSVDTKFENLTVDMSETSNVSNEKKNTIDGARVDGRKVGKLLGVSVGTDGIITASYSNGMSTTLGQICVAKFANAMGLENAGDNLYQTTASSGDATCVDIKAEGIGSINSGILEMSNVDLSQEFTNMITTQRGFQANSRIITTSDTLLEELINLKR